MRFLANQLPITSPLPKCERAPAAAGSEVPYLSQPLLRPALRAVRQPGTYSRGVDLDRVHAVAYNFKIVAFHKVQVSRALRSAPRGRHAAHGRGIRGGADGGEETTGKVEGAASAAQTQPRRCGGLGLVGVSEGDAF